MPSPLESQRSQSSPSSQRMYCSGQGSFTPRRALIRANWAWVMFGSRTSARSGLPESDISKYDRIVIPKKIGTACTKRRKIYLDIIQTCRLASPYRYVRRQGEIDCYAPIGSAIWPLA